MAYSYTWPVGLPQSVNREYSESSGALLLQSPMDAGPAKMRRRGQRPHLLNVSFYMTTAQVATLETFCLTTISATARFGFPHPRTGATVEARIIPQQNGELYTTSFWVPGNWVVAMTLEVLP